MRTASPKYKSSRRSLASIRQPTDNVALWQEIADLSLQVAALSAGQDRLHARFKELDPNLRDRGPSPKDSRPPSTAASLAADPLSRGDTTSSIYRYHCCFGALAQNYTPPCS